MRIQDFSLAIVQNMAAEVDGLEDKFCPEYLTRDNEVP